MESPSHDFLKFNIDAHFDEHSGRGITGILCRDDKGRLITGATTRVVTYSALVAETLALREAISLASNLNCSKVIFESDSFILIDACKGKIIRSEIQNLICDIKEMEKSFTCCEFQWIKRQGNRVADAIVKAVKMNQLPRYWVISFPPSRIQELIEEHRHQRGERGSLG